MVENESVSTFGELKRRLAIWFGAVIGGVAGYVIYAQLELSEEFGIYGVVFMIAGMTICVYSVTKLVN